MNSFFLSLLIRTRKKGKTRVFSIFKVDFRVTREKKENIIEVNLDQRFHLTSCSITLKNIDIEMMKNGTTKIVIFDGPTFSQFSIRNKDDIILLLGQIPRKVNLIQRMGLLFLL
jgi:hypothetical protein